MLGTPPAFILSQDQTLYKSYHNRRSGYNLLDRFLALKRIFYIISDVKNPFLVLILHKLQNLSSFVFLHCLIYKVHAAVPLGDSLFILPHAVRFVKNFFQLFSEVRFVRDEHPSRV